MGVPRSAVLLPLLLLLLLMPTECQDDQQTEELEDESLARLGLLKQRDAIDNWADFAAATNIRGWDQATPICSWTGVFCISTSTVDGFSVSLACDKEMSGASLCAPTPATGTLVPLLATTPSLTSLDFSGQNFFGTLPDSWGASGTFTELISLNLSRNQLAGALPDEWSNVEAFPQLNLMNMSQNNISGFLPDSWGDPEALPWMKTIDLTGNQLSGTLRASWTGTTGGFQNISNMHLGGNLLTGTMPGLWMLPDITELFLNDNLMTGSLPTGTTTIPDGKLEGYDPAGASIRVINLSNNKFSGELPREWGFPQVFSTLFVMDLSGNNLTGNLPAEWAFQALRDLSLAYNELSGAIPTSWGYRTSFPEIRTIDLSGNALCGQVPAGLPSPLCDDGTDNCITSNVCAPPPPSAPPPPTPPPCDLCSGARPPPPSSSSASSVNVGAIVGGVVGGSVVIGILAFLALRPGKAWLHRRQSPAEGPAGGGSGKPSSCSAAAGGGGWRPEDSSSALAAYSGLLGNDGSIENDPLISYIASNLAALRRVSVVPLARRSSAHSLVETPASGASATSGSNTLPLEVQQWEVQWEDIRVMRLVGRGAFGRVYLASWRQTPVAVKVLTPADNIKEENFILPESVLKELQEEASVMTRMRHPNVVSFMGLSLMPPLIVTEFCEKGSLYDVLRRARQADKAAELTWQLRIQMALDAARGLLYLHRRSPPIIHRDVKSPNLLVEQHWRVKVADFNLSKILGAAGDTEGPSNPIWLAPEIALNDAEATAASDVYSFGMVLYELLTWKLPWEGYNAFQIMFALGAGQRPELPPRIALPGPDSLSFAGLDAYCELMRDCWAEEPGDRPTFDNIVPRLDSLVHRGDIPSSMSSHGKPRGGSQKMDEADEECGSPIKRWGTAPIM